MTWQGLGTQVTPVLTRWTYEANSIVPLLCVTSLPKTFRYAAQFCASHLARATCADPQLAQELDHFCGKQLCYWLELLSLTMYLSVATKLFLQLLLGVRRIHRDLPRRLCSATYSDWCKSTKRPSKFMRCTSITAR
jgi:hypothetical protein